MPQAIDSGDGENAWFFHGQFVCDGSVPVTESSAAREYLDHICRFFFTCFTVSVSGGSGTAVPTGTVSFSLTSALSPW